MSDFTSRLEVAIDRAVSALRMRGGVALYPTETLYGLGGRAGDPLSAARICAWKGRDNRGFVLLALDPPLPDPIARELARAFWPGPLSIIIPGWDGICDEARAPDGSVAVRLPVHPVTRALVAALGPITSTSANRSGELPIRNPMDCPFPVDAVVDVGVLPVSPPSTLVRGDTGQILREGAIPSGLIQAALARLAGA